jgi:hypothetical protein
MLDRSCASGLTIRVGDRTVATQDLLDEFGRLLRERSTDTPIFLFAKPNVAIEDLHYLTAILGKVGYRDLRFYSLDESRDLASRIDLAMLGEPVSTILSGSAPH